MVGAVGPMAEHAAAVEPDPGTWATTSRTSDLALLVIRSRRRDPCAERVAIELERRRTPAEVDRIAHSQADSLAAVINTVLDGIGLTPEQRDRGTEIAISELRRATSDDPPWAG
jgi:hypothetical protein